MVQDENKRQVPSEFKRDISILTIVEVEECRNSISEKTFTEAISTDDVKNNIPNYKMSKTKVLLVFISLSFSIFLVFLDQTIVTTTLPAIAIEFESLDEVSWIGTAYLLTTAAFQPVYGKLSDIFGRKPIFLMAIFLLELGTLLCGLSTNMCMLIISRAVAGLGLVMIIITEIVPMQECGKYQGMIGSIFGIASVVGPLLGGAFTDKVSWRWAFLINLPLGVITFISIVFLLHLPKSSNSFWEKLMLIDWWGTFTLVVSTILLLLSLNWAGSKYQWNSPIIIVLLCFGCIGYVLFVFIEGKIAKDPIAPGRLFKNLKIVACFSINLFHGMAFIALLYFVPFYFQVVKSESATTSGLELLPYVLGLVFAPMFVGQLVSRTTYFSYGFICAFGSILMAIGTGLISTFSEYTNKSLIICYLFIAGIGAGLITETTVFAGQEIVEHKDVASVISLLAFFRTIGAVFGVAILGTVFNNVFYSNLPSQFQALDTAIKFIVGMSILSFIFSLPIGNVKPHRDDHVKIINSSSLE
ncbi:2817_t:CDS:10 [Dentiscutata heterogama]|uniref:2817_t:CDS:1 n=1 Tax=Dentiscutata heterogama TaxID=1316150 RepID=A0ACA9KSG6_9GLOM|nr:2817_t:CDS:10 [Dentiscutata heterogama]